MLAFQSGMLDCKVSIGRVGSMRWPDLFAQTGRPGILRSARVGYTHTIVIGVRK